MKKIKLIIIALFLSMAVSFSQINDVKAGVGDSISSNFSDPKLAQAIADLLSNGDTNIVITSSQADSRKYLNLAGKDISDISGLEVFKNLEHLILSQNNISNLADIFNSLPNLKIINLDQNKLSDLPSSFGTLTNLEHLWLSTNNFTKIPNCISTLTNLIDLNMDSNKISVIPDFIYNLTKLEELEFNHNEISYLSNDIGKLTNLLTLWLSNNKIASIPDSIGNLSNLKWLTLSLNQITSLPDSIGNLTKLKDFYIGSNKITKFPESIINMGSATSINHYELRQNAIIYLSSAQKAFISSDPQIYYFAHSYTKTLNDAYVASDYEIDAYQTYETDLLNTTNTVEYNLLLPDGTSKTINVLLNNGKLIVDKDDLSDEGTYQLVATIKNSSNVNIYTYTYNFKALAQKVVNPSNPIDNNTITSSLNNNSAKIPTTGNGIVAFISIVFGLSLVISIGLVKRKNM